MIEEKEVISKESQEEPTIPSETKENPTETKVEEKEEEEKKRKPRKKRGTFPKSLLRDMIKSNGVLSSSEAQSELDRCLTDYSSKVIRMAVDIAREFNRKTVLGKDIRKSIKLLEMR